MSIHHVFLFTSSALSQFARARASCRALPAVLLPSREMLLTLAVLTSGALLVCATLAPKAVVVLFVDDSGYADIGPLNASQVPYTPHITALGRDGITFSDFHAAPLCTPSRAALQTGRVAARTGVHRNFNSGALHGLSEAEITLGDLARSAGWATHFLGKCVGGVCAHWRHVRALVARGVRIKMLARAPRRSLAVIRVRSPLPCCDPTARPLAVLPRRSLAAPSLPRCPSLPHPHTPRPGGTWATRLASTPRAAATTRPSPSPTR